MVDEVIEVVGGIVLGDVRLRMWVGVRCRIWGSGDEEGSVS